MILNDYDKLINEHFDLFDAPTRKCIVALEDSEQSQLLGALSNALYNKIVTNIDKIDFGSIPRSRGDITKVDKFEDTEECLLIMKRLVQEYKQDPQVVDNVLAAIENIKKRKAQFVKGFSMNIKFIMNFYNLMVMSIEQSVSFLISVCIQYIKDPDTKSIAVALDRVAYNNAKDYVIYEQIVTFNNTCNDGSFDKILDAALKNKGSFEESVQLALTAKYDQLSEEETPQPTAGEEGNTDNYAASKDSDISHSDAVEDTSSDVTVPEKIDSNNPATANDPSRAANEDYSYEIDPSTSSQAVISPKDIPQEPGAEPVHEEDPESEEADFGFEIDPNGAQDGMSDEGEVVNDYSLTNEVGLTTVVSVTTGVIILYKLLISVFIPMLRNITYFLIHSTMKLSDSLAVQAHFIELNAYNLQTSSIEDDGFDDKKRDKIVSKQMKVAENLKKASNKIALIFNKAEKKAKDDIVKDFKKTKIEDLKDDVPADIYNKSVLF
mgnify:CR=1 FL=1